MQWFACVEHYNIIHSWIVVYGQLYRVNYYTVYIYKKNFCDQLENIVIFYTIVLKYNY